MNLALTASSSAALAALALAPFLSRPDAPAPAARPPVPQAAAVTWTVDAVHSSLIFRVKHLNASWFYGRFNGLTGSVTYDAAKPAEAAIQFEVDAASVDTANKDRDDHLRSPDFLNAKVHPKLSFRSTKVAKEGDKLQVTGVLSLHGVEKEIAVTAAHTGFGKNQRGAEVAGFEASFTVKRSEFGIATFPDALSDEIHVSVAIQAAKKS
jgi:polyisoprenoid-binding protein YceI